MFSAPDKGPGSSSMVGTSSRRTSLRLKQSRNLGAPEFASIAQQKNVEARLSGVEVNHSTTSTGSASYSHQEEKYNSKVLLQDKKNLHNQEQHSKRPSKANRICFANVEDNNNRRSTVSKLSLSVLQTKVSKSHLVRALKVQDNNNDNVKHLRYSSRLKSKMSSRCRSALRTVKVKNSSYWDEAGPTKGKNIRNMTQRPYNNSKPSQPAASIEPSVSKKRATTFFKTHCEICGEVISMNYMRKHTIKRHGIQKSSYIKKYGEIGILEDKPGQAWKSLDKAGQAKGKKMEKRCSGPDGLSKPFQPASSIKPNLFKKPPKVSDDLADFCKTRCEICGEVFTLKYMREHTRKRHGIQILGYKNDFGECQILETVFHKCHICGELILWSSDKLDKHTRIHKVMRKEYTTKYCTQRLGNSKQIAKRNWKTKVENQNQKAEIKINTKNTYKAHKSNSSRSNIKEKAIHKIRICPQMKLNLLKHLPYRFPKEGKEPFREDSSDSSEDSSDSSENSSDSSEDSSDESLELSSEDEHSKFGDVWYNCSVSECSQCED